MPDLSRSQFCGITSLSTDALSSLSRRGQLPFSIDQKASGRGYTVFEAYLTIVSQTLQESGGVSVTRAAEITSDLPSVLELEWFRVVDTARMLVNGGVRNCIEIVCGRVQPLGLRYPMPVCGTYSEIAQKLEAEDFSGASLITCGASRCLAMLINRCAKLQIEIPDEFWSAPFSYRERPSSVELIIESMKNLVADGEHLKDFDD